MTWHIQASMSFWGQGRRCSRASRGALSKEGNRGERSGAGRRRREKPGKSSTQVPGAGRLRGSRGVRRQRRDRGCRAEPDVVVLDWMLPGLDGVGVLRELRRFSDAYVIMLTARAEE